MQIDIGEGIPYDLKKENTYSYFNLKDDLKIT